MVKKYTPPSRENTKPIAGHFDPEVRIALKKIALNEDTTLQELLREGINAVFTARKKKPIA